MNFALSRPPAYPNCGQRNQLALTPQGIFAIKEMMRHGMLIDIDHMSEKSQDAAIAIAKSQSNGAVSGYPLNSGHSGVRGFFPQGIARRSDDATERSMDLSRYREIALLHGMAGVGSAGLNSYQWLEMYQQVVQTTNGAVAGLGTDTDGLALGMPPRSASSVPYDDSFPRSSLGTKWWNYNTDGVAHYGMLADFVKDARTSPSLGFLIDNNLMFGADYFLQTWKKCETLKAGVK